MPREPCPGLPDLRILFDRNLGTDLSQGKGGEGGGFLVKVFLLRLLLSNYYVGSTSPTPSKAEYGADTGSYGSPLFSRVALSRVVRPRVV